MKSWLFLITEQAIVAIHFIALLAVCIGTLEAAAKMAQMTLSSAQVDTRRTTWVRYARWLVAGLTFQLAADIVESSISTSWDAVGRLGVVAVIRTFLNFFLERDLAALRERPDLARERVAPSSRESSVFSADSGTESRTPAAQEL